MRQTEPKLRLPGRTGGVGGSRGQAGVPAGLGARGTTGSRGTRLASPVRKTLSGAPRPERWSRAGGISALPRPGVLGSARAGASPRGGHLACPGRSNPGCGAASWRLRRAWLPGGGFWKGRVVAAGGSRWGR